MLKLEIWIALRYLLGQRKAKGLVSTLSIFSFLGIFLACMVPLVILSIMGGFQKDIKEKILSVNGHIAIYPIQNRDMLFTEALKKNLESIPGVLNVEGIIESQALIETFGEYKSILIRGIDPDLFQNDPSLQKAFQTMSGSRDIHHPYYVLLGNELKETYALGVGRRLPVIAIRQFGKLAQPKRFDTLIQGSYKTGYLDYDKNIVLTSKRTLERELGMDGRVTKIVLRVKNQWNLKGVLEEIHQILKEPNLTLTWQEENEPLFKALNLERLTMWFIMLIIVCVAVFNVISSQALLVVDKKKEIGILKTLGYTPAMILRIFLYEALILTFIGASLGLFAGTMIVVFLGEIISALDFLINIFYGVLGWFSGVSYSHTSVIPSNVYYIDAVPTDLNVEKIMGLFLSTLFICFVSGLIPAYNASKRSVLEVMRQK